MEKRRYQSPTPKIRKNAHKAGVWEIQYRNLNNQPRRHQLGTVDEMNYGQACLARDVFMMPINQGLIAPPDGRRNETLAEFVEREWFPSKIATTWRDGTADTNTSRIRKHVLSRLGAMDIRRVNRRTLQTLLNDIAPSLSESTVNSIRFMLGDLFNFAHADQAIEFNPAGKLYTPGGCRPPAQKPVIEASDAVDKASAVLDCRDLPILLLTMREGLRIGEALGLRVGDLNFDGCGVSITRALSRGRIGRTKNGREREAGLSATTGEALRQWIATLNDRSPDAWLFPSDRTTGPIRRDGTLKRVRTRLKAVGLDWVDFRIARRTAATNMKNAGVDAHTRAAQLGHTVNTQEKEYAIASHQAKVNAVAIFDKKAVQ